MSDTYATQHAWVCDHIMSLLPGADSVQVQRTFTRKLDHFLQRSSCWIEDKTFVSDVYGNVDLDFSSIDGQMVWIHNIFYDGKSLSRTTVIPGEPKRRTASVPHTYTNSPYPNVIVLNPGPLPGTTFSIEARCALTIADCSTADIPVPDWIFSRYKEAIRSGVLGDMTREIGKPYTNLTQARMYLAEYSNWVGEARDEARRGFGHHEAEWVFPQGFK